MNVIVIFVHITISFVEVKDNDKLTYKKRGSGEVLSESRSLLSEDDVSAKKAGSSPGPVVGEKQGCRGSVQEYDYVAESSRPCTHHGQACGDHIT